MDPRRELNLRGESLKFEVGKRKFQVLASSPIPCFDFFYPITGCEKTPKLINSSDCWGQKHTALSGVGTAKPSQFGIFPVSSENCFFSSPA